VSQYTLQFIEETIDLQFNWMTEDIKQQVFFWNQGFAVIGDSFRYFPDEADLTRFFTCKLAGNNKVFSPARSHRAVENFNVTFANVRVIAISAALQTDRDGFFP